MEALTTKQTYLWTPYLYTCLPNSMILNSWSDMKNNCPRKRIQNLGMSCNSYPMDFYILGIDMSFSHNMFLSDSGAPSLCKKKTRQ